ncbi:glycine cleavage system protein T [Alsobacter metallidurans]|uniref:Glycine cleavage system protein T n=1 Tax=Alsobacter metallidurans TaxID=340221 RepID=A0A917IBC3_9HYPH|nr:FAD-dependent oxidoreductase [Alsobacter metallidurans]GGH29199.1 glycine cleavage system protein T [Alsobacter metallidurans]
MKTQAQAVIIGGGVVGCSVLYHLAKAGWTDVVLIERAELTSGSTWHAAGGFHTLNGDPNVAKLQQYTVELYREIEALSGVSCGLHLTGGVMLAGTPERMDWLRMAHAKGRYLGMHTEIISAAEAKRLMPLIDESRFVGAMYDPLEGHLDPYGTTHAYAKSAQLKGAEIVLRNRVVDTVQRSDGTWDVVTEQGTIHAQHVVNAGGLWARECGRMAGLELPVLAMEHMYLLTEDMPEVAEVNASTGKEVITALDFEGEIYTRQERGGMLMGTYERAGKPWSETVTPWDFGQDLLEPDLDRIAPSLEVGFEHFPAFARAGIKKIINGPFTFAPDGNPLVGPVRGLRNYWVACGVMAGFSQGGGVGLALANWMIQGDPGFDVWAMDVARYGDWATLATTNARVKENYSRRFRIRFPNEELEAGRPLRTTPLFDRLKADNAVMGESYGLEYPLWFAPRGTEPKDVFSFRRSNAFGPIGEECRTVRERVGVLETSGYAKYEVTGPGAEAFLCRVLAGRMPAQGRITLTPMLNERGKLIGDFTVGRLGPERFLVIGSGPAEQHHMRWFLQHAPASGVRIDPLGQRMQGLSVAGPRARELLQRLVRQDLSTAAFPFLSIAAMDVGPVPAIVGRISFTGDLGYEIWVEPDCQRALFDALWSAGEAFGVGHFGLRALNALRLEKSFGTWAREYRPIYGPVEAGLGRFIRWSRPDFIGADAALAEKASGGALRLVTFKLDARDADAIGDEPIWCNGQVVGWITSGGYAHGSGVSVAMGYVPVALADARDGFEVEVIGERVRAKPLPEPLFDPSGARLRA